MTLETPGWVWPVPLAPDGRRPEISDGYHAAGNPKVRGGEGHRGQDIMYRRRLLGPANAPFPWSSPHYEMFPRTPAIAANEGRVYRSGRLATGWHVILEHGDGVGTGYHHLSELLPGIEHDVWINRGQPLGIIGGPPAGYPLVHLHFDVAIGGRFIDAAQLMRRWGFVALADAWGNRGRVGGPPP
jgi:hypothetical protein